MVVRKIECSKCNTVYKIDASKLPDKVVRSKCKKCGNVIVIKKQTPLKNTPLESTVEQETKKESIDADKDKSENPVSLFKEKFLKTIAPARDKVQGFFMDDNDDIDGLNKIAYTSLKVFSAWMFGKIVAAILGIFLPAVMSGMIGISVFVLLLNWKTLVELTDPSELFNILLKEKWAQFTVPFVLANLYAFLSETYDVQLLPLVFAIALVVSFAVLPFFINYKLAVSSGRNVPLTMLLTVIFSWLTTLYLSFITDETET